MSDFKNIARTKLNLMDPTIFKRFMEEKNRLDAKQEQVPWPEVDMRIPRGTGRTTELLLRIIEDIMVAEGARMLRCHIPIVMAKKLEDMLTVLNILYIKDNFKFRFGCGTLYIETFNNNPDKYKGIDFTYSTYTDQE